MSKMPERATDFNVGGKTPEEIKADVATCLTRPQNSECNRFALYAECKGDCRYVIKELYGLVLHYKSRLAQAERDRDAAVHDINFYQSAVCFTCSNQIPPEEREDWRTYCKKYGRLPEVISDKRPTFCSGYNWRGVCDENTKEENK